MNSWVNVFLEESLRGIPQNAYRKRVECELCDHLLTLSKAMETSGLSPNEAQENALAHMGDPHTMNRNYRQEWLRWQATRPTYVLGEMCVNFFVMFVAFLVVCQCFQVATHINSGADQFLSALGETSMGVFFCGAITFLPPFALGGYSLSYRLRWHPHKKFLTCAGLVSAWVISTAVISWLIAGLYGVPMWDIAQVTDFACHGSDFNMPWFTPFHLLWTLGACIPLGLGFSSLQDHPA